MYGEIDDMISGDIKAVYPVVYRKREKAYGPVAGENMQ